MPGNALLPPHQGMIITRGLQEWACLLPQDLPFAPVARLLGWQTHEPQVLADTTIRMLVRQHGQLIRQAEQTEVDALLAREDLADLQLHLAPRTPPRRRAGWPAELTAAVDAALAAGAERPPRGVTGADWERVLAVRRAEGSATAAELRYLGPELAADEVLLTADEVLTRARGERQFWELRTARVVMPEGTRVVSGVGDPFLTLLLVLAVVCTGRKRRLLVLGDGARWLRAWFVALATQVPGAQFLLDWYHLRKRCAQLGSMVGGSRKGKVTLLRTLYRQLWQGEVATAIATLEEYRPRAQRPSKVDELIGYLEARAPYIANYRARRRARQYIGSGHAEKANDLLVAQRQKGRGMHWSLETSDALAALHTLLLNDGWDRYWQHREVLPLVAP
jgi:hypothetical protein